MDVCILTLNQMLTMFMFIISGYLLRKLNILPDSASGMLSKLETFFFAPVITLYSWAENCTVEALKENSVLILWGLVLVIAAIILAYPLSYLFVRKPGNMEEEYQRSIYRYATAFGNYGFMGNYLVLGIWGTEMFFLYSMFTLFVGFVCSSWGIFTLIPKKAGEANTIKSIGKRLFTPPVIALIVGLVFGLCGVKRYMPEFLTNALSDGSACFGPIGMLLAGVVIGGYDVKELLTYKKVYIATFLRLILIPACMLIVLRFFGAEPIILQLTLIAFATPLGLNTIVYPAAYGGDTKTGASMTIISHVLSVATIPLMYYIFLVL